MDRRDFLKMAIMSPVAGGLLLAPCRSSARGIPASAITGLPIGLCYAAPPPGEINTTLKDLFKVGPGPSSSHTVAPVRIASDFRAALAELPDDLFKEAGKIEVRLFGSLSATNVAAIDYGYVTFHDQVPPFQIAWQVDLLAGTGEPAIAVRQSTVANEYISTAMSATANAPFETFTLVPPTLTDGSYYLTVWGTPPFTATLMNSRPVITPVDYAFSITNDLPSRQGWRFYSVTNIVQQGGLLGWELLLNNVAPGTEIAVRRNAVPGRWA